MIWQGVLNNTSKYDLTHEVSLLVRVDSLGIFKAVVVPLLDEKPEQTVKLTRDSYKAMAKKINDRSRQMDQKSKKDKS